MAENDMTQRELAARLEMSETNLSRILAGKMPISTAFIGNFAIRLGYKAAEQVLGNHQEQA